MCTRTYGLHKSKNLYNVKMSLKMFMTETLFVCSKNMGLFVMYWLELLHIVLTFC